MIIRHDAGSFKRIFASRSGKRQRDGTYILGKKCPGFSLSLWTASTKEAESKTEKISQIITKANFPSISLTFRVCQEPRALPTWGKSTVAPHHNHTEHSPDKTSLRIFHTRGYKAKKQYSRVSVLSHPKLVLEVMSQAFPFDLKHYFHTIAISELLYYDKCFSVVFKIAFSSAMVLCVCVLCFQQLPAG